MLNEPTGQPMKHYHALSRPDLTAVHDVADLLRALQLSPLLDAFTSRGIAELKHIAPSSLDEMGLSHGIRLRLLRALAEIDQRISSRMDVAGASDELEQISLSPMNDRAGVSNLGKCQAQKHPANSTSSLYIESTIAHPDMLQVCFCTSLVVYDLIVESEAAQHAVTPQGTPQGAPQGAACTAIESGDPYSLFRPRDIFSLPGKRNREAFEGSLREVAAGDIPTEEDIRSSIADVHALSHFSPGCLVVALIYIERLRRGAGALLLASTWQPTLLISIIVAQKVWEDRTYMNVDFTRLCPSLTLQQLNTLERDFLQLVWWPSNLARFACSH